MQKNGDIQTSVYLHTKIFNILDFIIIFWENITTLTKKLQCHCLLGLRNKSEMRNKYSKIWSLQQKMRWQSLSWLDPWLSPKQTIHKYHSMQARSLLRTFEIQVFSCFSNFLNSLQTINCIYKPDRVNVSCNQLQQLKLGEFVTQYYRIASVNCWLNCKVKQVCDDLKIIVLNIYFRWKPKGATLFSIYRIFILNSILPE